MDPRKQFIQYTETISVLLLGILFVCFPLLFTSVTTDAFILPKQLLLGAVVGLSLLLLGAKMIAERRLILRTTPFDLPLIIFIVVGILSSVFSVNRFSSLIALVPLIFAVFSYFVIVNAGRTRSSLIFLLGALTTGAAISSLLSFFALFKLYLLPFPYAQNQNFTVFGSYFDEVIYLTVVFSLSVYVAWPEIRHYFIKISHTSRKSEITPLPLAFAAGALVIALGIGMGLYQLFLQHPLILPFDTGFQTAFAAISQDTGRIAKSFFMGSGYGTYLTDFTRFKQATYNLNPTLWSFTFFRSSSFVLELLATVGFLGIAAYIYLCYKAVKERAFLPVILILLASFILPFSFIIQTLVFFLLGLFAAIRGVQEDRKYSELHLSFVMDKQEFVMTRPEEEGHTKSRSYSMVLPIVFFVITLLIVGTVSYFTFRFFMANVIFQKSLYAVQANDGKSAYELQQSAIATFPYEDEYYTRFSQLNLALANSIALAQPKGASPSAQVQQNILALTQQSINAARTAVALSPLTAYNWNNLSSIYRSLIGFGQNADQFAVLTNQQAIALDSNNPDQYITLGGIYYQLQLWDEAIRQFSVAVNLKPDYANAYYNLGHAYESKGDLNNALAQYQAVQTLIATDATSSKKIAAEIEAVKKKIGDAQANAANPAADQNPAQNQAPIAVPTPPTQLPPRNPKVVIPAPATTLTPSPSPKTSTTPSPSEEVTPTP